MVLSEVYLVKKACRNFGKVEFTCVFNIGKNKEKYQNASIFIKQCNGKLLCIFLIQLMLCLDYFYCLICRARGTNLWEQNCRR